MNQIKQDLLILVSTSPVCHFRQFTNTHFNKTLIYFVVKNPYRQFSNNRHNYSYVCHQAALYFFDKVYNRFLSVKA